MIDLKSHRRTWILAALCVGLTGLFVGLHRSNFIPLERLEYAVQDHRARHGRRTPMNPDLVLIGVDKSSYEDDLFPNEIEADPLLKAVAGGFPWPRSVWAAVIERLIGAGARVVALDFIFSTPGSADDALADVVAKYPNRVVLGGNLVKRDQGGTSIALPYSGLLRNTNAALDRVDPRVGLVNIFTDFDEVLRNATYRYSSANREELNPGEELESLAARMLRSAGQAAAIPAGVEPLRFRYTAPPGNGFSPVPLFQILVGSHWTNNFLKKDFFRDKLVLIGPTANYFQDKHTVPLIALRTTGPGGGVELEGQMMPGPEIHLNMLNAAIHGTFLQVASRTTNTLILTGTGLVAFALMLGVRNANRRLLIVAAVGIGAWFLGQVIFDRADLVINEAAPLMLFGLAGLGGFAVDFTLERMDKRRMRRAFERQVGRVVAKELLDNPDSLLHMLDGERRPVTVLFSDVRGFTTLTETADARKLVSQINEYLREMVCIVHAHHGRLDKFIGDGIMADWGSLSSSTIAVDARLAVATAVGMLSALEKLNADWAQRGMFEFKIGIGVNHGEVVVGNLGSEEKSEVTVIGDPVNLAARLEGATKEFSQTLLISESTAALVRDAFVLRTVAFLQVKGKTRPVEVFAVVGERRAGEPEPAWLAVWEDGVKRFRARDFAGAIERFTEFQKLRPDDPLTNDYVVQSREFLVNPPPPDWTGVIIMKSK